jgi:hypothetical protein
MIWFVKGNIAQKKGEKVKWVKVIATIAQEKTYRQ